MTEVRMLEHLFDQHTREFEHQKQLYCELADELKCMEPMMDSTKRRILAEHSELRELWEDTGDFQDWQATVMPVARWTMRTADSVLLTC